MKWGESFATLENWRSLSAFKRRKVPFSGATWFFTYFQQREPKCKLVLAKFAFWKQPECSYAVVQCA